MATDSDSKSAFTNHHRRSAINHRSASGHLELTQRPHQASIKWPSIEARAWHWSQQLVLTSRQSPDWRPRRASVAGCQQQVIRSYQSKEFSESTPNQARDRFSLVEADKLATAHRASRKSAQQNQRTFQQQRSRYQLMEPATGQDRSGKSSGCIIKVSGASIERDRTHDQLPVGATEAAKAGQCREHLQRYRDHNTAHRNRRDRPRQAAEVAEQPSDPSQTRSMLAANSGQRASSRDQFRQVSSTGECKLSQDLTFSNPPTPIAKPECQRRQLGRLARLNGSSLDLDSDLDGSYSSRRADRGDSSRSLGCEPSATTTCCSNEPISGEPLHAKSDPLSSTTVSMNEKLQIQDKQRKFHIISMALKKMISRNSSQLLSVGCAACCSSSCPRQSNSLPARQRRVLSQRDKLRQGSGYGKTRRRRRRQKNTKTAIGISRTAQQDSNQARVLEEQEKACTCSASSQSSSSVEEESNEKCLAKDAKPFNKLTESSCPDCRYFTNSCEQEVKPELKVQGGVESVKKAINMTRDDEEAERYDHDNDHLRCVLSTARDYCASDTRRASFGSDSNDNKCIADEREGEADDVVVGNDDDDEDNASLESLIVESWLDDHPKFVHDYFMRKASRHLIDDWLVARAKVSNTNLMVSSHLDLVNPVGNPQLHQQQQQLNRAPSSLSGHLHDLASARAGSASPAKVMSTKSLIGKPAHSPLMADQQPLARVSMGGFRPASSRNQSGTTTPVRKISATDFESRTGSGYLRPMVSTTPDGRPTFLSQSSAQESGGSGVEGSAIVGRQQMVARPTPDAKGTNLSNNNNQEDFKQADKEDKKDNTEEGEVRLIFELVKNICNDLDIRTLLHKILRNIAILINADKSSLFLVCGEPGDPNRHLVSQLFNVDQGDSECREPEPGECITIPWNTGLVGYVAESGESVNIANCYEDPRFTSTVDQRTGYVTKHMLCAPIYDKRNEIVGVAQVINKRDGKPFSKKDEIKFKRYLQFCGIGLRNAQSYENCQLENKRNQVLLDLARMVFEEQSTIEQVVYRIMLHTQSLLECQRCQVLLIDDGSDDLDQLLQTINSPQHNPLQQPYAKHESQASNAAGTIEWRPQGSASFGHGSGLHQTNDHCTNQLLSKPSPKLFTLVFDLECDGQDLVMHSNKTNADPLADRAKSSFGANMGPSGFKSGKSGPFPLNIGITGYVAMTGETLNIEDAHQSERFDPKVDEGSSFQHKSILCMPIRNGQRQIIGVSQLINKKNGRPFNKNDEDLFEAFLIFCGLGIHNTLMYEKVLKVMAKQRVTFEVLSYHATAPLEEAKKLHLEQVPSCFSLNLASLKFNDFSLDEQFMTKSCLRFFLDLDLIRRFQIDQLVFCNWILSVQKNYRKVTYHPIVGGNGLKASPVRYHNWRHAFNVTQMMFAILISTQMCTALGELETLALLIACLCHDLDHRGTNNSFQIKSASPLAELYSTSTMEHHHFDQCVMILNSQGNQILANLSPDEYSRVIVLLEEAILATDLAKYFQKRELFFQLVNSNNFDWHDNLEHRSLLRCMLMTACDVAASTKPWSIQKVVADLVMSEFYQQGDIEKQELNIEPIDMMNRDKMSKLPEMQISFIDSICAPIYTAFAKLFPQELSPLLEGCLANRDLWHELEKQNNDYGSDLASYLNNNITSSLNVMPKIRNTSSPEVNLIHDRNEERSGGSKMSASEGSKNNNSSSSLTGDQPVNKSSTPSGNNNQQTHHKTDCPRKSV